MARARLTTARRIDSRKTCSGGTRPTQPGRNPGLPQEYTCHGQCGTDSDKSRTEEVPQEKPAPLDTRPSVKLCGSKRAKKTSLTNILDQYFAVRLKAYPNKAPTLMKTLCREGLICREGMNLMRGHDLDTRSSQLSRNYQFSCSLLSSMIAKS